MKPQKSTLPPADTWSHGPCLFLQNCLIRLTPRGREALVTDFGLAREVVELPVKDLGRKLSLVGSAFWMAPEMLRGEPYDRKVVGYTLASHNHNQAGPITPLCFWKPYGADENGGEQSRRISNKWNHVCFMSFSFALLSCRHFRWMSSPLALCFVKSSPGFLPTQRYFPDHR